MSSGTARKVGVVLAAAVGLAGLGLWSGCEKKQPPQPAPQTQPAPTTEAPKRPVTAPEAMDAAPTPGPAPETRPAPADAAAAVGTPPVPAPGTPPTGAKKSYVIGVIAKSNSNQVFLAARTGAEDAARDLSAKYGIDVKIDWRTPNTEDAQRQAQNIEQLVSAGVSGITISVTDAKVLTSAINAAVDRGVPVVTFDSDASESKRFATYGMDDEYCGKLLMREMSQLLGGKGVVAVLAGNQTAPNLQARVRGVREEGKNHPGIRIKDVYYHAETAVDAVARLEQVQGANPDIEGWIMVGGWPLFTANALDKIVPAKVVAVDTLPQQLEYVKKGEVHVLLGQKCHGWGYETVTMLVEKLHNNKLPASEVVSFEPDRVTRENVARFEGLWQRWLSGNTK